MGGRTPDSCIIRTEYPNVIRTPSSNAIRIPDLKSIRTEYPKGRRTPCSYDIRIPDSKGRRTGYPKGGRTPGLWITKILHDDSYLSRTEVAALLEGH